MKGILLSMVDLLLNAFTIVNPTINAFVVQDNISNYTPHRHLICSMVPLLRTVQAQPFNPFIPGSELIKHEIDW